MASFRSLISRFSDVSADVSQQLYTKVGLYRGSPVAVKYTGQTSVNLKMDVLRELKEVSYMYMYVRLFIFCFKTKYLF